jgi:hypothetical protein
LTGGNISGNYTVGNASSPNTYYLQFGDNTGWVYRFMTNVSGTPTERFKFTDGGAFNASSNITINGSQVLAASNYNSYAPTLTGTGASGTWGISISGNAATATTATTATTANALNTGNSYTISGLTVSTNPGYFRKNQTDGSYTSAALWTESYGATTTGIAFHISGVVGKFLEMRTSGILYWNSDVVLSSGNYNSYAPTLTGTGASGTWSINVTGSAGSVDFNSLTNKTGGTGTYTTSGDFRAPIFYDSNDPSYYVDPNNVSLLNNLIVNGGAVSNNNNGLRNVMPTGGSYVTGSSYVSGAIVITLPQTVYPMIKFRVSVYTYDGLSFDIYCGGHTSSGFWYNTFAYMGTQNRSPLNVRFTYGSGLMYVYIGELGAVWSFPQVFITDVQVGYTNYEYDRWDNGWTISFNSSTYNNISSTHLVNPPPQSTSNYSAIYAPVLYDYNDTGYYVDPDSTSNAALRIRGGALHGPNPTWGKYLYVGTDGNPGTGNSSVCVTNGNLHLDAENGYVMYLNNYSTSSYTIANQSIRSPIFYDSNDTAYYCDPSSQSLLYYTSVNVGNESTGGANSSSAGLVLRGNYNSNTWAHKFHKYDNGGGVPLYLSKTVGTSTWSAIQGWGSGLTYDSQVFGSFGATTSYATIFYDSDNTGTYINPNGASIISSGGSYPMEFRSTQRYITRFYNLSVAGNGFWLANDANTLVFHADSIGDVASVNSSGVFYASNSFRAPIFYDSDNTAYYTNPNGLSVLSQVYQYYSGSNDSYVAENITTSRTQQSAIRFYRTGSTSGFFGTVYGGTLDWTQVKPDNTYTNTAQIYARNIVYGGIDNTISSGSLYLNANATSGGTEFASVSLRLNGAYSGDGTLNIAGYDSTAAADRNWVQVLPSQLRPGTDNYSSLGLSSRRWTVVYATTGTINTSDRTQKDEIRDLETAEKAVAVRIKSLFKAFKFKDAIQKKGDGARIHVGVIAQDVQDAFIAEGLDPNRYALFCSDTFKVVGDVPAERDDLTNEYPADAVDKTILGVRYDELLAFVISAI